MTLVDLTAHLMGDPSAAYRRPPTDDEANGRDAYERVRQKREANRAAHPPKDRRLLTLPIGGEIIGLTRAEANIRRNWLLRNEKWATVKRMPDGMYRLRRLS